MHLQQIVRERGLAGAVLFYSRDILYYTGTAPPCPCMTTGLVFGVAWRAPRAWVRAFLGLEILTVSPRELINHCLRGV